MTGICLIYTRFNSRIRIHALRTAAESQFKSSGTQVLDCKGVYCSAQFVAAPQGTTADEGNSGPSPRWRRQLLRHRNHFLAYCWRLSWVSPPAWPWQRSDWAAYSCLLTCLQIRILTPCHRRRRRWRLPPPPCWCRPPHQPLSSTDDDDVKVL